MRAGLLKDRVTFRELVNRQTSSGLESNWEDVHIRWARVQYERGVNAIKSFALTQTQTLSITVRYDRRLNETMRVEYDGGEYQLNKPIIDRSEDSMTFIATLIDE